MKLPSNYIFSLTLLAGFTSVAYGDTVGKNPVKLGGNIAFVSDYVFRGFTQTDGGPAVQGGLTLTHESGGYASLWGSNVKFLESESEVVPEDRAHLEMDYSLGYGGELSGGWNYDANWVFFTYPNTGSELNYDAHEFTLKLGYKLQGTTLAAAYSYSPDDSGGKGKAHYYKVSTGYVAENGIGFNIEAGHKSYSDDEAGANYTHYLASISYSIGGVDLLLSYSDTDLDSVQGADGRTFFSVNKSF